MKKWYIIVLLPAGIFISSTLRSQDSSGFCTSIIPAGLTGDFTPQPSDRTGQGISIEVAHGQAFTKWSDAWLWVFSSNCIYHFNKRFAFGLGGGIQFDYTDLYPWFSVNSIFGNKVNGFAFSFDVNFLFTREVKFGENFWPTAGLYYRNFFIKHMPTYLFGYEKEYFIQLGYSYYLEFK